MLERDSRRGTFEARLGEFNGAIGDGLSAGSFEANEASLLLKLLAFNLAGMLRGELEDASGCGWDRRRVQQTVLKAGAQVVEHGQQVFMDVAQAARVLWGRWLDRVQRWRSPRNSRAERVWGRPPRPRRWGSPQRHAHLRLVLRECFPRQPDPRDLPEPVGLVGIGGILGPTRCRAPAPAPRTALSSLNVPTPAR